MSTFTQRMIGAARLDSHTYEEVEADRTATSQALAVVVLASLAAAAGSVGLGIGSGIGAALGALVGWFVWAMLIYLIGTRLFPEPQTQADVGELLRTLGFAAAPGVVRVLGIVPGLRWPIFAITAIWMLVTTVVAVRQALDYRSTLRAIGVCSTGWLISVVLAVVMGVLFGPTVQ